MKIYFAGSIAGGREYAKYQQEIVFLSKKLRYKVFSEHVSSDKLQKVLKEKAKNSNNFYEYISRHERGLMKKADLVVAECSQPSLGTGFEICFAAYVLMVPVIALRYKNAKGRSSATVFGDDSKLISCYYYDDRNLEKVLGEAIDNIKGR